MHLILIVAFTLNLAWSFSPNFTQKGVASYYASKFHGKRTASGVIYHKDSLFCAHKTLKFGTVLKVVNLKNDSTVFLKVVDRLGKKSPHLIDVSYKAAQQLNFVRAGITQVEISY